MAILLNGLLIANTFLIIESQQRIIEILKNFHFTGSSKKVLFYQVP